MTRAKGKSPNGERPILAGEQEAFSFSVLWGFCCVSGGFEGVLSCKQADLRYEVAGAGTAAYHELAHGDDLRDRAGWLGQHRTAG